MPNAGPASIAVMLPGNQSYCWDTGACRFRYAWSGGGIKSSMPATNGKEPETLVGTIYYSENIVFPLRIGDNTEARPKTAFLGYRIDKSGSPELEYTVDGVNVRESVSFADERTRRLSAAKPSSTVDLPLALAP